MDKNALGFSLDNLLSDLGRTMSISDHSNLISCIIFNISLGCLGLTYIVLFFMLPQLFHNIKPEWGKIFSILGSIIGILMGCGYIGTALTPADLFWNIHVFFGFLAFSMGLPCAIFYGIALIFHPKFPRVCFFLNLIFSVLDFSFLYLLFKLISSNEMNLAFALVQKTVVYFLIIILLLQAIITRKILLLQIKEHIPKSNY